MQPSPLSEGYSPSATTDLPPIKRRRLNLSPDSSDQKNPPRSLTTYQPILFDDASSITEATKGN